MMTTQDHSSQPETVLKPGELPPHPRRILVADDEHLVSADLVMMLCDKGYTVVGPVGDGEAAVRLAYQAGPDMAILDIRLPKLDGLGAAKRIFSQLGLPVIILSAYSDDEFVESAREAGVFGYLVKPAKESQLRASIEIAWERFRQYSAASK